MASEKIVEAVGEVVGEMLDEAKKKGGKGGNLPGPLIGYLMKKGVIGGGKKGKKGGKKKYKRGLVKTKKMLKSGKFHSLGEKMRMVDYNASKEPNSKKWRGRKGLRALYRDPYVTGMERPDPKG